MQVKNLYPPHNLERFQVFYVLNSSDLLDRTRKLNKEFFKTKQFSTLEEAYSAVDNVCKTVVIVEESCYGLVGEPVEKGLAGLIIVTEQEFNLKDRIFSKINRDLFLTDYLDEFIFWALEKASFRNLSLKREEHKKQTEKIIDSILQVSRMPTFGNKNG